MYQNSSINQCFQEIIENTLILTFQCIFVVNAYKLFCKRYDALANSVLNTCCMYVCMYVCISNKCKFIKFLLKFLEDISYLLSYAAELGLIAPGNPRGSYPSRVLVAQPFCRDTPLGVFYADEATDELWGVVGKMFGWGDGLSLDVKDTSSPTTFFCLISDILWPGKMWAAMFEIICMHWRM